MKNHTNLDDIASTRALIKDVDALTEALANLVVWAEWHRKRHPHPLMNEPNTGALSAAKELLALAETGGTQP